MLFIICRCEREKLEYIKKKIKDILDKFKIKDVDVKHEYLRKSEAWIGLYVKSLLSYDEINETEEYFYEESNRIIKQNLDKLHLIMQKLVQEIPEIELVVITDIPGTWPWGPDKVEDVGKIYSLFIAYNSQTYLGDRIMRSLLFRILLNILPDTDLQKLHTLLQIPFFDLKEFVKILNLKERNIIREVGQKGILIVLPHDK